MKCLFQTNTFFSLAICVCLLCSNGADAGTDNKHTCGICFMVKDQAACIECSSCEFNLCSECLVGLVRAALSGETRLPLRCPGLHAATGSPDTDDEAGPSVDEAGPSARGQQGEAPCEESLDAAEIQRLLDQWQDQAGIAELRERLTTRTDRAVLEQDLPEGMRIIDCPFPDCPAYQVTNDADFENLSFTTCPLNPDHRSCVGCNGPFTEGHRCAGNYLSRDARPNVMASVANLMAHNPITNAVVGIGDFLRERAIALGQAVRDSVRRRAGAGAAAMERGIEKAKRKKEKRKKIKEDKKSNRYIVRGLRSGRYDRCPSCGISVEKNGGCDHMTCQCGRSFTWRNDRDRLKI